MLSKNRILSYGLFLLIAISMTPACQTNTKGSAATTEGEAYELLSQKRFKKQLKQGEDYLLIDVRTPEEYEAGHIEGARNIDFLNPPVFEEQFSELDTTKTLMIYCRSGNRSRKSAAKLREMGFKKIYDLEGGYSAWKQ